MSKMSKIQQGEFLQYAGKLLRRAKGSIDYEVVEELSPYRIELVLINRTSKKIATTFKTYKHESYFCTDAINTLDLTTGSYILTLALVVEGVAVIANNSVGLTIEGSVLGRSLKPDLILPDYGEASPTEGVIEEGEWEYSVKLARSGSDVVINGWSDEAEIVSFIMGTLLRGKDGEVNEEEVQRITEVVKDAIEIPTKVSELTNDSEFTTLALVLEQVYKKSETLTADEIGALVNKVQDELDITVDPTPTEGSENAVSSGGVYDALQEHPTKDELETYFETESIKVLDRIRIGAVTIYKTTKTEDDGTEVEAGYIYTDRGNIYTTKGNVYTSDGDIYTSNGDIYTVDGDFVARNGSYYKGSGDEKVEVAYKNELATKVSELTNDSNFTTLIEVLVECYKKSETYTQSEVNTAISNKIAELVDSAPETLDTLKELADAITENAELIDTLNEAIGLKLSKTEAELLYATINSLSDYVLTTDSRLSDSRPASDVYDWAKAETKPTYTAAEVGALPSTTEIPTKVSELTNDSEFIDSTTANLTNYYLKTETFTRTEAWELLEGVASETYVDTKLATKVDMIEGKSLSTNDFTDALKAQLEATMSSAEVAAAISLVQGELDTLVGGDASSAIDSYNEIIAFLSSFTDSEDLASVLLALKTEIVALIPSLDGYLTTTIADSKYVSQDGYVAYSTDDKTKVANAITATYVGIVTDFDNYTTAGVYGLLSSISTLNAPVHISSYDNWSLEVLIKSNYYCIQKATMLIDDALVTYSRELPSSSSVSGTASQWIKTPTATELESKVDKDGDKVLSDNNYTDEEKAIVSDLLDSNIENILAHGIQFDTTISTPTCTRIGSTSLHKSLPIHNQMKGCLLADDGTVNEYLPSGDWSAWTRDGSAGQVMIEIPKHYRKFVTDGTVRQVWLSEYPLAGYDKVNKMYVSAYEASLNRTTTTLASVANSTTDYRGGGNNTAYDDTYRSFLGRPATNISLTNFRTYARKRKSTTTEWNCMTYEAQKTIFWLFVTEYATLNSQSAINAELTSEGYKQGGLGNGATTLSSTNWGNFNGYYPFIPCGHTDSLGNGTGEVLYEVYDETNNVTISTYANRYRGIENPFGHIWQWTDGILVDVRTDDYDGNYAGMSRVLVAQDPANFASHLTLADTYEGYEFRGLQARTSSSYIKEIIFGESGDIIGSVVGGSSSTYFCDHNYTATTTSEIKGVRFGGSADTGSNAGLACSNTLYAPSSANASYGSRLCFIPNV